VNIGNGKHSRIKRLNFWIKRPHSRNRTISCAQTSNLKAKRAAIKIKFNNAALPQIKKPAAKQNNRKARAKNCGLFDCFGRK
jgi:hypothetical protein